MLAWSSSSRSHDSCMWATRCTDCPQKSFVCWLGISESWESKNKSRLYIQTLVISLICVNTTDSWVGGGLLAIICTSAPFPWRGKYPPVSNVCQIYKSSERGFTMGGEYFPTQRQAVGLCNGRCGCLLRSADWIEWMSHRGGWLCHNSPEILSSVVFLHCAAIYEVRLTGVLQWRWAYVRISSPQFSVC